MLTNEIKKALRKLESGDALQQLLSITDTSDLTLRDVDSISRAHRKLNKKHDCKVAYLGNHTIEPLDRFVETTCLLQDISISSYLGEYDQHFQEILDPNSGCHRFQPDIIFIDLSLRVSSPTIYYDLLRLSADQRKSEMQHLLSLVSDWIALAKNQTDATLIVSNFQRPARAQAGIADAKLDFGETEFYSTLNLDLLNLCKNDSRVYFFDTNHALSCTGKFRTLDPKMYYLAKMEWTEPALLAIADELLRYLTAILGRTKKCLVLDLDNTLWGGIVGEEGIDGLNIGEGSAEGEAFLDFQRYILSLKERGILLALCSKNNYQDAENVFLNHNGMQLKLNEFSAVKINWEHKHINLQAIARDLNIGIDSLVFVDDNPVERELIRQMLPEVTTVELSSDPSTYTSTLTNLTRFEKVSVTAEDQHKSVQYLQNAERAALKHEISDINTFLASLGTEITISEPGDKHKARIHQLFLKTNQFNLTTHRYSLSDVEDFLKNPEWTIHIAQVKDNFGDMGIIGLYLIHKKDGTARIDSFIMSCRAMGRGIETAMMNKIKEDYLMNDSFDQISAIYIPTAKNIPVIDFYDTEGFNMTSKEPAGEKKYLLNRQHVQFRECAGITIRST
jgi:FkbH-like protein